MISLKNDKKDLRTGWEFRWKPENLRILRNKREYELNQGHSYRDLPPPPVLPPIGKLEKITGRLDKFESEAFHEYFDCASYQDVGIRRSSDMTSGEKLSSGISAISMGSPVSPDALGLNNDSEAAKNGANYIQGEINGLPFKGWVGMTRLQVGDEVELVATWHGDHYMVYAITLPAERILSITPQCEKGHIAYGWWRFKAFLGIVAGFVILLVTVWSFVYEEGTYMDGLYDILVTNIDFLIFMYIPMAMLFFGFMGYGSYQAHCMTTSKLAEEIFTTLGFQDPAEIDLVKITKARERQLYEAGLWYSAKRKSQPLCPDYKYHSLENWYYY